MSDKITHRIKISMDVAAPAELPGLPMSTDWTAALGLDDPAKLYPLGVRSMELNIAAVEIAEDECLRSGGHFFTDSNRCINCGYVDPELDP